MAEFSAIALSTKSRKLASLGVENLDASFLDAVDEFLLGGFCQPMWHLVKTGEGSLSSGCGSPAPVHTLSEGSMGRLPAS